MPDEATHKTTEDSGGGWWWYYKDHDDDLDDNYEKENYMVKINGVAYDVITPDNDY